MHLRDATQADILYVASHSISGNSAKAPYLQKESVFTLEYEGEILGVGGIRPITATTAMAWIDASDKAFTDRRRTVNIVKQLEAWIQEMQTVYNFHRLQAYVEVDFTKGITLVEHLGFKPESRMKEFFGDKDVFLFVRFF